MIKRSSLIRALFFIIMLLYFSCSSDSESDPPAEEQKCEGGITATVTNETGNSAEINWSTSGSYSSYEIEYGETGFTQGQGIRSTHNSKNASITGLEVDSEYDVFIRGNCPNNGSAWFGPFSFATICDRGIYMGNVELTSQEEVDAFTAQCYTGITGNLSLISEFEDPEGIRDLSGFVGLTEVLGDVKIESNTYLPDLEGLDNLKKIVSLTIKNNTRLESIKGLRNLEEFVELPAEDSSSKVLRIFNNDMLTSLEGLEKVNSVPNLSIVDNILTSLSGLKNLETVEGSVSISLSQSLENLDGLQALKSIGEFLTLHSNKNLKSLSGLENLATVGKSIQITANEQLERIGTFANLNQVEHVFIQNNHNLQALTGLNISGIEYFLQLLDNDSLTSFDGVVFNDSTSAFIEVAQCDGFLSMDGLEGLTETLGLQFISNKSLTTLDGLQNLVLCRNQIRIEFNPLLKDFCALTNLIQGGGLEGSWDVDQNGTIVTLEDMMAENCN